MNRKNKGFPRHWLVAIFLAAFGLVVGCQKSNDNNGKNSSNGSNSMWNGDQNNNRHDMEDEARSHMDDSDDRWPSYNQ